MTATRFPLTVVRYGANAAASSAPMPTTGKRAVCAAARESANPTGPKSRPWLFAIVTTSTPAARNAVNAEAGARKR